MTGGAQGAADAARKGAPKPARPLSEAFLTLSEFMAMELPERKFLVGDWLPEEGLALLYAWRGTGKSWFATSLALAAASGEDFCVWKVPRPVRTLYVQAEMPMRQDQDRLNLLQDGAAIPDNFVYLSHQHMLREGGFSTLKIDSPGPQSIIRAALEAEEKKGDPFELIILDAYSALITSDLDQQGASDVSAVTQFLIELRLRGPTILLLQHTGKDRKSQRGSSALEDQMDTSILLERPDTYKGQQAEFKVTFPKSRDLAPEHRDLILTLTTQADGRLGWTTRKDKGDDLDPILKAVRDGDAKLQVDLEGLLDITRATASRRVRKCKHLKLLKNEPGLMVLTDKGEERVPRAEDIPF